MRPLPSFPITSVPAFALNSLPIGEAEHPLAGTDNIERVADGAVISLEPAAQQDHVVVTGKEPLLGHAISSSMIRAQRTAPAD
jgi:hypothetical protein